MTQDEYLDQHFDDIDLPDRAAYFELARTISMDLSIDDLRAREQLVGRPRRERPRPELKPCRLDENLENEPIPLR